MSISSSSSSTLSYASSYLSTIVASEGGYNLRAVATTTAIVGANNVGIFTRSRIIGLVAFSTTREAIYYIAAALLTLLIAYAVVDSYFIFFNVFFIGTVASSFFARGAIIIPSRP